MTEPEPLDLKATLPLLDGGNLTNVGEIEFARFAGAAHGTTFARVLADGRRVPETNWLVDDLVRVVTAIGSDRLRAAGWRDD